MNTSKKLTGLFLLTLLLPLGVQAKNNAAWVGANLKGAACTGPRAAYGPWDYTKPEERSKIPIVEEHHFTADVQYLIKGHSTNDLMGDINYTLIAVPNHHKALLSVIRYQMQLNNNLARRNTGMPNSVECYLQRAINFNPKDYTSFVLYAYFLKEIGQLEKSAEIYEKALEISPNNPKIEYSYALLLIDLKKYDKSVEFARNAYTHSHNRAPKGLKNKLIKLGFWKDLPDKEADDKKTDDKITDAEKLGIN